MPSSTDSGNDIDWLFMNLASATPVTDDLLTPAFSLSNLETPPTSLLHHFDVYSSSPFNFGSSASMSASMTQQLAAEPKSAQPPKYDDGFLAELFQFLEGGSAAASPNPSPVVTSASETLDFFSADFTLFDTSSMHPQQPPATTTITSVSQNKSIPSSSKCGGNNSTSQQQQQKSRSFKCHVVGCTKVYAHNRNLTAHVRLDHSGTQDQLNSSSTHPFHCKVCNAGFRYSQTRNRHERNFHPML
ncbi:hypothetical protein BJ741DRAFT_601861, partial [Chytriomyces cf. hyalinus JEL632]